MKKTINIIDTNVLLHDPQALFNFPEQLVVIPISVIEELDTFKRNQDELGKNARYVTKQIDLLREKSEKTGDISSSSEDRNIETYGIELYNKGRLVIELNHIGLLKELDQSKTDNRILSVAKHYNTKFKNHTVCLVTKDSNLRIKSDAYGVKAIDYQDDMIQSVDESYSGLKKIELSSDNFFKLKDVKSFVKLSDIKINEKLFENQYILLVNESNKSQYRLFKHITQDEQSCLVKLITPENSLWGLTAKNLEQQCAIDALLDPNISLVTLSGKAGTGKTLISIAAALFQSLDEATYKKTLIARPIFALGKDIGYLPGPQPLDAKILTPTGWTTMGELKIGDYVIGRDGKKTKVLNIFEKGKKEVYKITTTDGVSTECCLDHLWYTRTWEQAKRGKEGTVKTTKEILETLKTKKGKINHYIPRNEAVEFKTKELPIPPYTLGCLLGDGSLSDSITLANTDQDLIKKVSKEIKPYNYKLNKFPNSISHHISGKYFNNKTAKKLQVLHTLSGNSIIYESIGQACIDLNLNKNNIRYNEKVGKDFQGLKFKFLATEKKYQNYFKDEIFKLGLLGKKAQDKFIPDIYLYNSIENRLELLRGLMDTDGSVKKNGEASFATISYKLAEQVAEIVRSLGGKTYIRTRDRTHDINFLNGRKIQGKYPCHEVYVSLPEHLNPFYIKRKAQRYSKKYIHRVGILSIEKVTKKECRCILVDNSEHLYLTNDYIVTHNTMEEKLNPWMQPIFDNLEFLMNMGNDKNARTNGRWKELIDQGMIQVEALTYIRGRSIPNQFFIIDESQNLTKHEIKTILSRAGMGTKIVLTGDPEQIDNPYVDQLSNGLSIAIETFKDDPIAAHITLVKGERSPLAEKAVKLIK